MNDKQYKWYLQDGSFIEGEEAVEFLKRKAFLLERLSSRIFESMSQINEYNCIKKSDDIFDDILENAEHLMWIQMELEALLQDISAILN